MEKRIRVNIPEGYEVDKEKSTFEEIVFKKVDRKPKSWKEYCDIKKEKGDAGYFISNWASIQPLSWNVYSDIYDWRNVLPNREFAQAFLALMQLMSLRQEWIHKWSIDNRMTDDWKPDWKNPYEAKFVIMGCIDDEVVECLSSTRRSLSFPIEDMATEFLNTFKDLIKIAAPLI